MKEKESVTPEEVILRERDEETLLERERTAKETKVDSSAKNATASEAKSEIEKETKTDETKKPRVPILSGKSEEKTDNNKTKSKQKKQFNMTTDLAQSFTRMGRAQC